MAGHAPGPAAETAVDADATNSNADALPHDEMSIPAQSVIAGAIAQIPPPGAGDAGAPPSTTEELSGSWSPLGASDGESSTTTSVPHANGAPMPGAQSPAGEPGAGPVPGLTAAATTAEALPAETRPATSDPGGRVGGAPAVGPDPGTIIGGTERPGAEPDTGTHVLGAATSAHLPPASREPVPAGPAIGGAGDANANEARSGAAGTVAIAGRERSTRIPAETEPRSPSGASTGLEAQPGPAPAVLTGATPRPAAGAATTATPPAGGSAAIAASDAVRFLRELGPARAVQRLAVDLDGTMVAVRLDQTGNAPTVRVQVVDDPSGRLDGAWASGVERTLTQSMQRDGAPADQRRRERTPVHPDDALPAERTGRRWARALGGNR